MSWPRIVAESLRELEGPARIASDQPANAAFDTTLAGLCSARTPARSQLVPPAFLLPQQCDPWRRVMSTLAAWNGA
ncbi:MAG: hypothetical protein ACRELE_10625, partial [Gemmatimonadales bacterium]